MDYTESALMPTGNGSYSFYTEFKGLGTTFSGSLTPHQNTFKVTNGTILYNGETLPLADKVLSKL